MSEIISSHGMKINKSLVAGTDLRPSKLWGEQGCPYKHGVILEPCQPKIKKTVANQIDGYNAQMRD